jgi:Fur family ferric uptake transcriptional regulator
MEKINPVNLLRTSKLKVTAGRKHILNILINSEYPLDVSKIVEKLKDTRVEIDQVTVYRILEKFIKTNLIEKTEFADGKYRYEFILSGHHHHHVICVKCGLINDINNCEINNTKKKINQDLHFKVQNHRLEFFGLCQNCQ